MRWFVSISHRMANSCHCTVLALGSTKKRTKSFVRCCCFLSSVVTAECAASFQPSSSKAGKNELHSQTLQVALAASPLPVELHKY